MPHYKNTYRTDSVVSKDGSVYESEVGCCEKRTRLEVWMICALTFTLITACASAVLLTLYFTTDVFVFREEIANSSLACNSKKCLIAAAELYQWMDEEINPCEDFRNFACAKRSHDDDDLEGHWWKVKSYDEFVLKVVRAELKLMLAEEDEIGVSAPEKMVKSFYSKCLDSVLGNDEGLESLSNILKHYWSKEGKEESAYNASYEDATCLNRKFGFSADVLLKLSLRRDFRNESRTAIYIEPPPLDQVIRKILKKGSKEKVFESYVDYMLKMAEKLGLSEKRASKMAREAVELDIQIAKLLHKFEKYEFQNWTTNMEILKVEDLDEKIESIRWQYFLRNSLSLPKVSKREEVIVVCPKCFQFFRKTIESSRNGNLTNYFIWKIIEESIKYLPREDFKPRGIFERNLPPLKGAPLATMEEYCTKILLEELPYSQDFILSKKTNVKGYLVEIEEIMNSVKDEFKKKMEHRNSSLSYARDTEQLLDTLQGLRFEIGAQEIEMDRFYTEDRKKKKESFNDVHRRIFGIKRKKLLEANLNGVLGGAADSHLLGGVFHPFYDASENTIYWPLSTAKYFYRRERPHYVKYASLGFITGHFLQQVFLGVERDAEAAEKILEDDRPKDLLEELEQSLAIEEVSPSDPKETQKRSWILQSSSKALRISYSSYRNWEDSHSKESSPAGLQQYNSHQLFWIAFAQTLCSLQGDNNNSYLLNEQSGINVLLLHTRHFVDDWSCHPR